MLSFVQLCALAPIVTCKTNREQQVARSGSELFVSLRKMEQRGAQPQEDCRALKAQMQGNTGAPRCNNSPAVSNCSSEGCNLGKKAKTVLQVTHRTNTPHVVKTDGAVSQRRKSNVYSALTSIKMIPHGPKVRKKKQLASTIPKPSLGGTGRGELL